MELNISPIFQNAENGLPSKPLLDDPYAYITMLDPLTTHQYYYIMRKIEDGWITDRDIELVRFILVHRWATLAQLRVNFFPECDREATVRTRIRKLLKYGLIRKIQWTSRSKPQENRPSFYELGASGADILKFKLGINIGQRDPKANKPTTMLYRMKHVITNEFYTQLKAGFNLVHFEFNPILKLHEDQQIPMAKYQLKAPKGKILSFILICHREDEKWLKTLRYQADFFKRFLAAAEPGTTLVILLSTMENATMANKILVQEGISDAWFVTDEDLYSDLLLTQSFFYFENEKKVYYDLS